MIFLKAFFQFSCNFPNMSDNHFNNLKICKSHPYGEHIALKCVNHPEKKWSTKNIEYIGARSIFYEGFNNKNMGLECDCPMKDLVHDHDAQT